MENNSLKKIELTQWVRQYTQGLFAWAYQKTGNVELSEDLVQETFLAASEKISSFKKESQPKTWLFGILKNKIAGHYRKVLKHSVSTTSSTEKENPFFKPNGFWYENSYPTDWEADTQHLLDIPDFNKTLDTCIDKLPTAMHSCIRLKFLEEKKGPQICEELGVSSANYWQLIRRAKLHLRACLERNWFNS